MIDRLLVLGPSPVLLAVGCSFSSLANGWVVLCCFAVFESTRMIVNDRTCQNEVLCSAKELQFHAGKQSLCCRPHLLTYPPPTARPRQQRIALAVMFRISTWSNGLFGRNSDIDVLLYPGVETITAVRCCNMPLFLGFHARTSSTGEWATWFFDAQHQPLSSCALRAWRKWYLDPRFLVLGTSRNMTLDVQRECSAAHVIVALRSFSQRRLKRSWGKRVTVSEFHTPLKAFSRNALPLAAW